MAANSTPRNLVGVHGKTIHSQGREIVSNVYLYFQKTLVGENKTKLWKTTACATGVGISSVRRIVNRPNDRQGTSTDCGPATGKADGEDPDLSGGPDLGVGFYTPGKRRPRESKVTGVDSFDLGVMRRIIQDCYIRNELPTLRSLRSLFEQEIGFNGGVESLRYVLKEHLGLKYRKINRRKVLLEKSDVVSRRRQYLRMKKTIDPSKSVFFLDETWVNEHHNVDFCWQDGNSVSGPAVPIGKGRRIIICHAGSMNGFVNNALLIFCSKTKSEDYHDEMNGQVFLEWFENQLLANIPENSVIVMDNASYHSVRCEQIPTMKTRKAEIQEWLTQHGIPWGQDMLKPELYELVKLYRPRETRYIIDELAKLHGHSVLRLPPYHCDLNPIELIWAQVKSFVARHNTTHKLKDVLQLTKDAVSTVSPANWNKACEHVKKIEDMYWEKDGLLDHVMEPLIISLSESSSSESESDQQLTDNEDDLGCTPLTD